jgi:hypothetical protein
MLWLLVALWPLLTAQTAVNPKSYSAESVLRSGKMEMVNRVFVGGRDRWRVEISGQPQVTIVRLDRKLMYTLLPAGKSYYELPMSEGEASPAFKAATPQGKVSRKVLGREQVAGRPTTKYEVSVSVPGRPARINYEWLSEELGVPIKMMAADKSWSMEYRNLKLGPQDPKLFEVPAGYKKLVLPAAGALKAPGVKR